MITMTEGTAGVPVTVHERFGDTEIVGELFCPAVTTENPRSLRFVEIELYKLDSGKWLIHRAGRSWVYHTPHNDTCKTKTGKPSGDLIESLDELPDNAMPCEVCDPPFPQDLKGTKGEVRYEFPRHTYDECRTWKDVVKKLTTIRGRDGNVSTIVSEPVAELLENAERVDPALASLPRPTTQIR